MFVVMPMMNWLRKPANMLTLVPFQWLLFAMFLFFLACSFVLVSCILIYVASLPLSSVLKTDNNHRSFSSYMKFYGFSVALFLHQKYSFFDFQADYLVTILLLPLFTSITSCIHNQKNQLIWTICVTDMLWIFSRVNSSFCSHFHLSLIFVTRTHSMSTVTNLCESWRKVKWMRVNAVVWISICTPGASVLREIRLFFVLHAIRLYRAVEIDSEFISCWRKQIHINYKSLDHEWRILIFLSKCNISTQTYIIDTHIQEKE